MNTKADRLFRMKCLASALFMCVASLSDATEVGKIDGMKLLNTQSISPNEKVRIQLRGHISKGATCRVNLYPSGNLGVMNLTLDHLPYDIEFAYVKTGEYIVSLDTNINHIDDYPYCSGAADAIKVKVWDPATINAVIANDRKQPKEPCIKGKAGMNAGCNNN